MLCLCTKTSQPFKLSSSSKFEEVAILSFITVGGRERVGGVRMGGKRENYCDGKSVAKNLGRSAEREDGRSQNEGGPLRCLQLMPTPCHMFNSRIKNINR